MKSDSRKTKYFDVRSIVRNARESDVNSRESSLNSDGKNYVWTNNMERVEIIRTGIPYASIEVVSQRLNKSVKSVLELVGLPQTTYNKKKSEHSLLDSRDSELIILITELIDYGMDVFNFEEEKFHRWLRKPNLSLGGNSPENMLDTITGIDEVKYCLNRLEFGNLA